MSTSALPAPPALLRKLRRASDQRRHWTEEQQRLVLECLDAGGSLREIAEAAGVSHQTIKNIAQRHR